MNFTFIIFPYLNGKGQDMSKDISTKELFIRARMKEKKDGKKRFVSERGV